MHLQSLISIFVVNTSETLTTSFLRMRLICSINITVTKTTPDTGYNDITHSFTHNSTLGLRAQVRHSILAHPTRAVAIYLIEIIAPFSLYRHLTYSWSDTLIIRKECLMKIESCSIYSFVLQTNNSHSIICISRSCIAPVCIIHDNCLRESTLWISG